MEEALLAIIALANGEFDNPHLVGFGPLKADFREQVKFIAEEGIKGEALILEPGQDRESYSDDQDRESYYVGEA